MSASLTPDFSKKSNPILAMANHYKIPHDVAYIMADMVLRGSQNTPEGKFIQVTALTEWHEYAEDFAHEVLSVGDQLEVENMMEFMKGVREVIGRRLTVNKT